MKALTMPRRLRNIRDAGRTAKGAVDYPLVLRETLPAFSCLFFGCSRRHASAPSARRYAIVYSLPPSNAVRTRLTPATIVSTGDGDMRAEPDEN